MNKSEIRNNRIGELTRMAFRGAKLDAIYKRAYEMASKKTANDYVEEVLRRVKR